MYEEIKESIAGVCFKMWQKGFVAANDGNVSVRVGEGLYLVTPSGMSKGDVRAGDIGLVDGALNVLERPYEGWRPSSELKLHVRCYEERTDIGAVVHAHPPIATGFAAAHIPLDDCSVIETVLSLGTVPLAPYATPSTDEVPQSAGPLIRRHDGLLLANHGAVTVGADLRTAYFRMETLEHQAHISLAARLLGGAKSIDAENIRRLTELRKSYGIKSADLMETDGAAGEM
ncbi:MAG: class II aldolase/adducin family protein [Ruminococcus sp.]|nr:class II aldolase/adducin family protein [Ruminococcus sp.]